MDKLDDALRFTLHWEGGYVNNPADKGGPTKWGISKNSNPDVDIENLTLEQAKEIYRNRYWNPINGDSRPFDEGLAVFDFAVHSGVSRALYYWGETQNVEEYLAARIDFLATLRDFNTFGRGWIRRVNDLTRTIDRYQRKAAESPDVELIQLYYEDQTFTFYPLKTTVGVSSSGRTKIMARLR